jgi:SWIM zinc finger
MPDFTIEVFFHCDTAEYFATKVMGSKGKEYTVTYGQMPFGPYEYDYHCTCEAYQFGNKRPCKHIEEVKKSGKHCNWNGFLDGEKPVEKNHEYFCPNCGSVAHAARHAV